MELVVAPGGSICLRGPGRMRRTLMPGAVVQVPGDLAEAKAADMLRLGYLKKKDDTSKPHNPPGVPDVAAIPSEVDASKFAEGKADSPVKQVVKADVAAAANSLAKAAREATEKRAKEGKKKTKKAPVSPWVMDPDGLKGRDLVDLNVIALEKGYDGEEFETAEEAIEFLSKDYQA